METSHFHTTSIVNISKEKQSLFKKISLEKHYEYHRIVKPLDNNIISRIGRMTPKTLVFSVELPYEKNNLIEYTSYIQLFLPNDQKQSIIDHPIVVKYPQPITVEFLPINENLGRSIRVLIRHLCLSYIEVKATVYKDLSTKVNILRSLLLFWKNRDLGVSVKYVRISFLYSSETQ
jgi:hypothetical protein